LPALRSNKYARTGQAMINITIVAADNRLINSVPILPFNSRARVMCDAFDMLLIREFLVF